MAVRGSMYFLTCFTFHWSRVTGLCNGCDMFIGCSCLFRFASL